MRKERENEAFGLNVEKRRRLAILFTEAVVAATPIDPTYK